MKLDQLVFPCSEEQLKRPLSESMARDIVARLDAELERGPLEEILENALMIEDERERDPIGTMNLPLKEKIRVAAELGIDWSPDEK